MKKAEIARALAWLLTEPDEEMVASLRRGDLYRLFSEYFNSDYIELSALRGFLPKENETDLLQELKEGYWNLFQNPQSGNLWWVESFHKAWTNDPECRLSIAREKGLLMGDSALHLLDLYHSLGIEIPDGFHSVPDHIILELEFLALLLESPSEEGTRIFVKDHFDWIPQMVQQGMACQPSSFYVSVFKALELFIESLKTGSGEEVRTSVGFS